MAKNKFTTAENRILTETYRRINTFEKGDIKTKLLLLETPCEVKTLIKKNILTCSDGKENERQLNWYKLTEKGKELFKDYIHEIPEAENLQIFEGRKVINFNRPLSEQN